MALAANMSQHLLLQPNEMTKNIYQYIIETCVLDPDISIYMTSRINTSK